MEKIDLTYLITTTGNNREMMLELIDIFIGQVDEFVDAFQDLNERKNYSDLGKMAHKAKSSVAIMGMEKLAKKMKELELLAFEGKNPQVYPSYINFFKQECAEALKELNDYKNNLQQ